MSTTTTMLTPPGLLMTGTREELNGAAAVHQDAAADLLDRSRSADNENAAILVAEAAVHAQLAANMLTAAALR